MPSKLKLTLQGAVLRAEWPAHALLDIDQSALTRALTRALMTGFDFAWSDILWRPTRAAPEWLFAQRLHHRLLSPVSSP